MASSKISNLPAASSVTGASLIAVVNSGDTYKATISQLPSGITSVNNLGGGTTLGIVSGSELQLKTLIAGTGLSFTTTSNTITLATTFDASSVGSGTSFINSFTNPNLAFKSITGSAGITVTDNTTSIDISNTVNSSLDSINGSIETPTVKEYVLELYVIKSYKINTLYLKTLSGSATVRISSDGRNSSTFTVNSSRSINIITPDYYCDIGDTLKFQVQTTTSAIDLSFTLDIEYMPVPPPIGG